MIPHGWHQTSIGKLIKLGSGTTKPDDLEKTPCESKKVPVYGGNGVTGYTSSSMTVGENIIIGRVGEYCGSVHYVNEACWVTDNALMVKEYMSVVSPKFLAYLLEHLNLGQLRNKGGQPLISQQPIYGIHVNLPPKNEQDGITTSIETWDRSIDLTERMIIAKQERRTWFMQQLLTGKRRLPEFEVSQELRKTPFGSLPVDWAYPRIGAVAKEASERNGEDAGRPVLSCTKHKGLVDSLTYFGKQIFSEDLSNYKVVRKSQFAYATNHIDEGSIGYQDAYEEALISPIYTVFQTDETIDDRFLFLVLKTETYRHIFASNTSASVDRRGSLRWSDFAKIHIPRPSINEQQAIVKVIDTADRELDLLRTQLDALREQKKGLMQQLLTGKLRVTV